MSSSATKKHSSKKKIRMVSHEKLFLQQKRKINEEEEN